MGIYIYIFFFRVLNSHSKTLEPQPKTLDAGAAMNSDCTPSVMFAQTSVQVPSWLTVPSDLAVRLQALGF